jgi:2-polyprenyl-6-methoxyphenol hydroxylase-like FAD-dependent oxidoreductase
MRAETAPASATAHVRCCIAGGGPAGMMLGFLLARAGVEVLVLEKHADFLRDFRGDTIHPSTLELMYELGLLEEFLKLPHQEARQLRGYVGDFEVVIADFSHVPTHCKFIALMPQWDFLNFLADHGRRYPTFHLRMQAHVTELIEDEGRIQGLRATTPEGPLVVRAELVVGADGRHSTVREQAHLEVQDLGAPIDVLWMRFSRHPDDPSQPLGRFDRGRVCVLLDRGDYWQCAYVIAKGGYEEIRSKGLETLRSNIAEIAPFLRDRLHELRDWSDINLLTVKVDRLRQWYKPGLLCIGDAAHAMSPIGGVGINLAVQDAVASANLLWARLRDGAVTPDDLRKVQRRREFPTRLTQRLQVFIQDRVISRVLGSQKQLQPPLLLRSLRWFPVLRRIPARLVGIGVRPEHVRTPDAYGANPPSGEERS